MERPRFRIAMIVGLTLATVIGIAAIVILAVTVPWRSSPPPPPQPSEEPQAPIVDSSTTGVPVGMVLTPSASINVTEPGTVIDGLDVRGEITIAANDVTIRNTRVESSTARYPIRVSEGVTGTLIERVEVDNQGSPGKAIYFSGGSGTVRHANIHSSEDGIRIEADDVTVEFSYIHHLSRTPTSHNDAIQIRRGDNVTIRGNNLQAYNPTSNDAMNAAIQVGSLVGDDQISNLSVVDNLMNGGNFTVNGGGRGEIESATFTGNRFGRDFRYGVQGNLENSYWDATNIWTDTRAPAR